MTINTIGKSQGYYPSLRDFKRMQNEDYEGLSKTHIKSLKFWKSVLDLSFLEDDPYLESLKTIKDLHKQFLELPIWMFTFLKVKNSFTKEEIEKACKVTFKGTSESAIRRDIKAFLNMYSENKPENIFYDLGLVKLENNKYAIRKEVVL